MNDRPHPRTGLNKECAAVCRWQDVVAQEDIFAVIGSVPDEALQRILARLTGLVAERAEPPGDGGSG